MIAALGGAICRCHDCRSRQAWFGMSPVPIGNVDPEANPWAALVLLACAVLVSLAVVWFLITR